MVFYSYFLEDFMECVFCSNNNLNIYVIKEKKYFFCTNCKGVFLDKNNFINEEQQKNRYLLHKNTLENSGYKSFLLNFLNPILSYITENKGIPNDFSIFDFGSGPNPCMLQLIKEKINNGILPKCTKYYCYDKFFTPEKKLIHCDLCLCLEVVEHFEDVKEGFKELYKCVKKNGFLAIGTSLIPPNFTEEDFKKWWYKEDLTHVSFYSLESLQTITSNIGFLFVKQLNNSCILFKKI